MTSKKEARQARKAAKKARDAEKAKALVTRVPTERPKAFLSEEGQDAHPTFCFRFAEHRAGSPACFDPTPAEAEAVFDFLCEMGRLSWGEIEGHTTGTKNRHKKHHEQPIESLTSEEAKNAIAKEALDETFGDSVFRFRLQGEQRLWGFRNESTFHVLWWDPNHEIYESEPS
ncbi:MAG: hypothetical protein JWM24_182 [Solirubrobacterales bacterium]|nr:hypothetical protein [Solirubrobacterales bacterium]